MPDWLIHFLAATAGVTTGVFLGAWLSDHFDGWIRRRRYRKENQ